MAVFGSHLVPADGALGFAFGALELAVEARADEWRLSWRHGDELDRDEVGPRAVEPGAVPRARVVAPTRDRVVTVAPALPDGDVVVRTEPAITVLPGARLQIHVGAPVGLALRAGGGELLADLPAVRLERTWFGRSVRDGELCLAMRTSARGSLAELPRRPHRAVTVLEVTNGGATPFQLERLRLPMAHLGLSRAADGRWWTDGLAVALAPGEPARLVVRGVPEAAGPVERVAAPRRTGAPNPLLRALDALFSERW